MLAKKVSGTSAKVRESSEFSLRFPVVRVDAFDVHRIVGSTVWRDSHEDPRNLGLPFDDWVRLETKSPIIGTDRLVGEVIFVDHFGNLITNIPAAAFAGLHNQRVQIVVGDQEVFWRVRTYGDAEKGTLVALVSSFDLMEVAVSGGSAQRKLGARVGTPVTIQVISPSDTGA